MKFGRIFAIAAVLSGLCFGQAWLGVVAAGRAIDWSGAGVTGGIINRSTPCGTQPSLTANSSGAAAANTTALNNAIAAASNCVINIGAITFFSNGFHVEVPSVTVRGVGADQTIMKALNDDNCQGFGGIICIWNLDGSYAGGPTNTGLWLSGYSQGSTTITLDNHANLKVGGLLGLDQLNDTYNVASATCSGGIVTANIGTYVRSPVTVTAQGFSDSTYNSIFFSGANNTWNGFPVTGTTSTTVSYNIGGACGGGSATGGVLTLDDGAFTISNDDSFASYRNPGNNPGRPANASPCVAPTSGTGGFQCRTSVAFYTVAGCGTTTFGAACTSNTITLLEGIIDPHIRADRTPGAWWSTNLPISGVGIENMTVDGTGASSGNIVTFYNATNSWALGLRTIFANSSHLEPIQSSHVTLQSNYMYGNQGHGGTASQSYCTDMLSGSSFNLVVNNTFQHCAVGMQNEASQANVYAYNSSIDNDNPPATGFPLGDYSQHSAGNMYNLLDQNQGTSHLIIDAFHGSSGSMLTCFRCEYNGMEPGRNQFTMVIYNQTGLNSNFIGYVFGNPAWHQTFSWQYPGTCSSTPCGSGAAGASNSSGAIFVGGLSGNGDSRAWVFNCLNTPSPSYCPIDNVHTNLASDSHPGSTYIWGGYDTVNAAVRFVNADVPTGLSQFAQSIPASHTLPASFWNATYYQKFWATPWGTPPHPAIGPDVSGGNVAGTGGHANYIPASLALQNMSVDNNYSTTSTVTAASCSGGVVTLTIGANAANIDPGTITVVTGIAPSGYNTLTPAAGTPRTQVSATTGTTISYAAPTGSCPGAYVSGGSATGPTIFSFNAANIFSSTTPTAPVAPSPYFADIVLPWLLGGNLE